MNLYDIFHEARPKKVSMNPHLDTGLDVEPDDPRHPFYTNSIARYTGSHSRDIANVLHKLHRNKLKPHRVSKMTRDDIQILDDIMANHYIRYDTTVFHGCRETPARIWLMNNLPVDKPIRIHLPAFTSTTTEWWIARGFSSDDYGFVSKYKKEFLAANWPTRGYNLLEINLKAGTPGLSVKKHSQHSSENEILLGRGVELEVSPEPRRIAEKDIILWSCTVVDTKPREHFE